MDLPGYGFVPGDWDLRGDVDNYLGNQDFHGKRVIDVGTGSGFCCFEMEKRGAEVTTLERFFRDPRDTLGQIPYADFEQRFGKTYADHVAGWRDGVQRMQNGFWLAHRALNSKARLYSGSAQECPGELGQFDFAFFGCVLMHTQNPLQGLMSFAQATREKIIITEPYEDLGAAAEMPVMFFRPNATEHNVDTWWYLSPVFLRNLLQLLGFPKFSMNVHHARFVPSQADVRMYTVVGER